MNKFNSIYREIVGEAMEDEDPTFQQGAELDPKTGEPTQSSFDVALKNVRINGAKFFKGLHDLTEHTDDYALPQGTIENLVKYIEKHLGFGGWASDRRRELIDFLYTVPRNEDD